jgi:hypothetical protein
MQLVFTAIEKGVKFVFDLPTELQFFLKIHCEFCMN